MNFQEAVSYLKRLGIEELVIDIDDTIVDFVGGFLEWANKLHGTAIQYSDVGQFFFGVLWGLDDDTQTALEERYLYNIAIYESRLMEGAGEVLPELAKDFRLTALSHRKTNWYWATLEQFKRLLPEGLFTDIWHVRLGNVRSPKKWYVGEKAILIDDSWDTIANSAGDINAIIFGEYGWNKRPFGEGIVVPRMKNWYEFSIAVEQMTIKASS